MPTATTSTSTAGAPSKPPVRHAVRPVVPVLTAVPVTREQTVTLPDGHDALARHGDWLLAKHDTVIDVVSPAQLARTYEPVEDRGLVLTGDCRTQIERTLGVGSTETPEHLVTAIDRMARLVIGDVRVDFTPGQWEYLAHRAEKQGLTVDQLVRRVVDWVTAELWTHL